jgi:hypothetical protein
MNLTRPWLPEIFGNYVLQGYHRYCHHYDLGNIFKSVNPSEKDFQCPAFIPAPYYIAGQLVLLTTKQGNSQASKPNSFLLLS